MPDQYDQTTMTRVKRYSGRGRYDRETVHSILDAGFYCHVDYNFNGRPYIRGKPLYSIRSKVLQPIRAYSVALCGVNRYNRSNPSRAASVICTQT
jgi:hypothetical protein